MSQINWKRSQPAPARLGKVVRANFPQVRLTEIYNDRNVAGTNRASAHAEGRAIDVYLDARNPGDKLIGDQLFLAVQGTAASQGIDNVIWNGQIWSRSRGGPRPYHGAHRHGDHLHIEFNRPGSQQKVLNFLEGRIAIIRSGLEEITAAHRNIA